MQPNLKKPLKEFIGRKPLVSWQRGFIILGIIFMVAWLTMTPQGLLGKADAVGYAVCHRIELRSFHIGERQSPLCARCTGQYLGAVLSLAYLILSKPRRTGKPPWLIVVFLGIFVVLYIIDGLNSYIHLIPQLSRFYLYDPKNHIRLATGTGLGLCMGVLVFASFNATIWQKIDPKPVLSDFKDFFILVLGGAVIDLLVLFENPLLTYPLFLISASGVFILLTMIYTMVLCMIFKTENNYLGIHDLGIMLFAGFMIALTQISILNILRFVLTGSWGGFHFG